MRAYTAVSRDGQARYYDLQYDATYRAECDGEGATVWSTPDWLAYLTGGPELPLYIIQRGHLVLGQGAVS